MTDDELILTSAIRYALGRKTYIVRSTADIAKQRWLTLGDDAKLIIVEDIKRAILENNAGMEMDRVVWQGLLDWCVEHFA